MKVVSWGTFEKGTVHVSCGHCDWGFTAEAPFVVGMEEPRMYDLINHQAVCYGGRRDYGPGVIADWTFRGDPFSVEDSDRALAEYVAGVIADVEAEER